MPDFSFDDLRRFPDVEAPNLFAVDASDRLILDEAADALAAAEPGEVVVIGDRYGALTLGAAALHGSTPRSSREPGWCSCSFRERSPRSTRRPR
jgi:16S rRNA (guanine1207-N2)-methyltransferase